MKRRKRNIDRLLDALTRDESLPGAQITGPSDLDELRAAIDLHAARPAADLPTPEFVASLRRQLSDETAANMTTRALPRRALITGASAAAAALAGVVVDRTLLHRSDGAGILDRPPDPRGPLDLDPGRWQTVGSTTDLADGHVIRFATSSVIGFVSRNGESIVAVSGACTHLGCLLRDNQPAGRLDCPCHRTSFDYTGEVLFSQLSPPPPALPRVHARRNDDKVEVLLPPDPNTAPNE
jgi:cytochrome b6-f complex iron-sulfur subunit